MYKDNILNVSFIFLPHKSVFLLFGLIVQSSGPLSLCPLQMNLGSEEGGVFTNSCFRSCF